MDTVGEESGRAIPMTYMLIRVTSLANQKAGFCAGVTPRDRATSTWLVARGVTRSRVAQSPLLKSTNLGKNLADKGRGAEEEGILARYTTIMARYRVDKLEGEVL